MTDDRLLSARPHPPRGHLQRCPPSGTHIAPAPGAGDELRSHRLRGPPPHFGSATLPCTDVEHRVIVFWPTIVSFAHVRTCHVDVYDAVRQPL